MKRALAQAVTLYESFREKRPTKLARLKVRVPQVVACIGHVESIEYRTTHGEKLTLYKHPFAVGSRPLLAVSSDGKQLLLLGGRFQFTDRGIVDRDAQGREIESPKHGRTLRRNPRGDYTAPETLNAVQLLAGMQEATNTGDKALLRALGAEQLRRDRRHHPRGTPDRRRSVRGNPRKPDKQERAHFMAWCRRVGVGNAERTAMWALFKDDPDYWSQAGWPAVRGAAG